MKFMMLNLCNKRIDDAVSLSGYEKVHTDGDDDADDDDKWQNYW